MQVMVRILWAIVFMYSVAMLVYQEAEWFKYRKTKDKTVGKTMKNYMKLQLKNLIPAIIGVIAVLIAFL